MKDEKIEKYPKLDLKPDRCIFPGQHVSKYIIRYVVYKSDVLDFPTEKIEQVSTSPCYSQFFYKVKDIAEGANKIATKIEFQQTGRKISTKEADDWVYLCRKNGFLPPAKESYINTHSSEGGTAAYGEMVIDFTKLTQSRLYIYLDSFRHLREDPGFIKAILYMVKECNMNFYVAFVLSSHFNISSSGHHCIQVTNGPYTNDTNKPNPKTVGDSLNLKVPRALYKLINDPNVKDTEINKTKFWSCGPLVTSLRDFDIIVPICNLNKPYVGRAVKELDVEKLKSKLKMMKYVKEHNVK